MILAVAAWTAAFALTANVGGQESLLPESSNVSRADDDRPLARPPVFHTARPPGPGLESVFDSGPRERLELSWKLDGSILATSAALVGVSLLASRSPLPAAPLEAGSLWRLDHLALGRDAPGQDLASTIIKNGLVIGGPLILAITQWNGEVSGLEPALVAVETLVASAALAKAVKSVARRPRPYMYGNGAGGSRIDFESFYSGHTAEAFTAVTATAVLWGRLQPDSSAPRWATLAGVLAASTVGVLRVGSGKHFPTDVVAGAAAGMAIGWLIPELHFKRSWRLVPQAGGMMAVGSF